MKVFTCPLLCIVVFAFCVHTPLFALADEAESPIQPCSPARTEFVLMQLQSFARAKMHSICKNIQPNEFSKDIAYEGGKVVARYRSVTPEEHSVVLKPLASGKYLGIISYREILYECTGKTAQDAATGIFCPIKARRITEIVRYSKGQWL